MFAWKKTLTKIGLALTIAILGTAEASAQQVVKIAEVARVGGYTISNDTTTVWANLNTAGRITSGLVQVDRKFHRGTGANQTLTMNGTLTASETAAVWNSIYAAQPWAHSRVRARHVNTDFPNTVVTYRSRYSQTIVAGAVTPPPLPLVSRAMEAFVSLADSVAQKVRDANLFVYDAAGGRAGYHRMITIHQDGTIEDVLDYASAAFASQSYTKTGHLTVDEVNALKTQCRFFPSWPRSFPGNPQMVDGIAVTVTYYTWGRPKSVFGGDPANQPRDFKGLLFNVEGLADRIP